MPSISLENSPNVDDWVAVEKDGSVTVQTGKVDIGQRVSTALAMVAAEELDVEYDRVQIVRTQTQGSPDEGITAGSGSMEQSATAIREATATARHHMLGLAAEEFEVDASSLDVADGLITSRDTNSTTTYGDLMGGKTFNIPVDVEVKIKDPSAYKIVGTNVVTRGLEDIISGKFVYVHDMNMEGMLHARVVRPPHYHATLKAIDEARIERLKETGVEVVVDGSFIAVAHADEFQAIKAAERAKAAIEWNLEDGLPVQDLYESLTSNPKVSHLLIDGAPVDDPIPELGDPPADATATLSGRYEKPYFMHGSIGPSGAMAVLVGGKLNIWSHSQGVYTLRDAAAEALGMEADDVVIEHVPGAGCYGHNGADDASFDAAVIATKIPGTPILLKWTRDDEHAWEPYNSAMVMDLRGSLDGDGNVVEWSHETYSDTHNMRPRGGSPGVGPGKLIGAQYMDPPVPAVPSQLSFGPHNGSYRNQDPLYTFPNRRVVKHVVEGLPLRCSALRGLGASGNVFALESFMDEMAEEARVDAVKFRLRNLTDDRAKAVIKAAAEKFGWPSAEKPGFGSGIAFAQYKNVKSYAAVAIEVEVTEDAEIKLHRAVIAADAGHCIDPNGLAMQLEGGLIQAASWTLYEEVTYDAGGVTSRDWDGYPILRFGNVPKIETVIMERSGDPFLGAGEATSGPTIAAISNAVYNATGLRLRRLPLTSDALKTAALE